MDIVMDPGGPLGFGRAQTEEVDEIWRRNYALIRRADARGVQTISEQPLSAYSWALDITWSLLDITGMNEHRVDCCMYPDSPP